MCRSDVTQANNKQGVGGQRRATSTNYNALGDMEQQVVTVTMRRMEGADNHPRAHALLLQAEKIDVWCLSDVDGDGGVEETASVTTG